MRKQALADKLPGFTPKCLTKVARLRAANSLLRLSKKKFDIGLLLTKASDNYWRSFHEWPDCIKARPVIESVTLDDLQRSDPKRAEEVLGGLRVKRIPLPKATSKLEMFQKLEKHLRKQQ